MEKCKCCNKEIAEENIVSFRLNDFDGFCHSSTLIYICNDCLNNKNIVKYTSKGDFYAINGRIYYDEENIGVLSRIYCKEQVDRIFNKEYYSVLDML